MTETQAWIAIALLFLVLLRILPSGKEPDNEAAIAEIRRNLKSIESEQASLHYRQEELEKSIEDCVPFPETPIPDAADKG